MVVEQDVLEGRQEQIAQVGLLFERAMGIPNAAAEELEELARDLRLPAGVTPERMWQYLTAEFHAESLPEGVVAASLVAVSRPTYELGKDLPLEEKVKNWREALPAAAFEHQLDIRHYYAETVFLSYLFADLINLSDEYYSISEEGPQTELSFVQIMKTRYSRYPNSVSRDIYLILEIGFLDQGELLKQAIAGGGEQNELLFMLKTRDSSRRNGNLRILLESFLFNNESEIYASSSGGEPIKSLSSLAIGMYNVLLQELLELDLAGEEESLFATFGVENARAFLAILRSGNIEAICNLENYLDRLKSAWSDVSKLPMNPPVLQHKGPVLEFCRELAPQLTENGGMTPNFIEWMFTEAGAEQREAYIGAVCANIASGMTMTGVDRIEWDFWKELFERIKLEQSENKTENVVHLDLGGSTGYVGLQLWGELGQDVKLEQLVNVDLMQRPSFDHVYEFDPAHYDRTLRLMSEEQARHEYTALAERFEQAHGTGRYLFTGGVDTSNAEMMDNPPLHDYTGKAQLVTCMRAQFLHGNMQTQAGVFENANRLLTQGGRMYLQRGLPTNNDLVLGVLYQKREDGLIVEAIQLNSDRESKTIWRLDENGHVKEGWEEELEEIYKH